MVKCVEEHDKEHDKEHDSVLLMLSNRYLIAKQVIPVIVPNAPPPNWWVAIPMKFCSFLADERKWVLHRLCHSLVVYNLKCHSRELNGSYEQNWAYSHPHHFRAAPLTSFSGIKNCQTQLGSNCFKSVSGLSVDGQSFKHLPFPPFSIIIIPFEIVFGDWCVTVGFLCAL